MPMKQCTPYSLKIAPYVIFTRAPLLAVQELCTVDTELNLVKHLAEETPYLPHSPEFKDIPMTYSWAGLGGDVSQP